jgi:Undecaprenyl-phosphate glucose phosphotransferase
VDLGEITAPRWSASVAAAPTSEVGLFAPVAAQLDRDIHTGGQSAASERISLESRVVVAILTDLTLLVGLGFCLIAFVGMYVGFGEAAFQQQIESIALAATLYLLIARLLEVYRTRRILESEYSTRRLAAALFLTFSALIAIGFATKTGQDYSRLWFFSWAFATCVAAPSARYASIARARAGLRKRAYVFRALAVGVDCAPLSRDEITRRTGRLVRTIETRRLSSMSDIARLGEFIAREEIDRLYVSVRWSDTPEAMRAVRGLGHVSAEIYVLPVDAGPGVEFAPANVSMIGDRLSITALDRPINGWDLWRKRQLDIVVSVAALVFLAPLLAAVALAIKLDSRGPVLFRQKRVGFNGRVFELYKFRSMFVDQADSGAAVQSSRGDPRVTRVGRFIRRTSIDELPQFFNVLRGTMSVVGPRPHALQTRAEGRALEDAADGYAARHRVKPGVTGLAQINGMRGELDSIEKLQKRVEYDIKYIDTWSAWLDILIIIRTALLVTHDPSAY